MNQGPYHILPLLLNIFQILSTKWDFSLFESLSDFFMSHLFNSICLVGVHTVNMFSTCVWNWSPWRGDKVLLTFVSYLKPTVVLKMESSFLSSTPQFQIHVKGCENSIFSVSISVENKMIDSIPNWSARLRKKMAGNSFSVFHPDVHLNCIKELSLKRQKERTFWRNLLDCCVIPIFIHAKWERLRDPYKLKD